MDSKDSVDANGRRYRGGGGHIVGESMPGTVGDSERVIHDKNGQTPTHNGDDFEVPSDEHVQEETTEDDGVNVEELVSRL